MNADRVPLPFQQVAPLCVPIRSFGPQEVRALMLECLQQQPAARPTSLQLLQRLRAVVEGVTPTGSPKAPASAAHTAGTAGTAGVADAAVGSTSPAVVPVLHKAMSIELRPTPPSPFAS